MTDEKRGPTREHDDGCPRKQFWDAGEWEAPCYCGKNDKPTDRPEWEGTLRDLVIGMTKRGNNRIEHDAVLELQRRLVNEHRAAIERALDEREAEVWKAAANHATSLYHGMTKEALIRTFRLCEIDASRDMGVRGNCGCWTDYPCPQCGNCGHCCRGCYTP